MMGGVWCRIDRESAQQNTKFSKWTERVRQAYLKPKAGHRPSDPPRKPGRVRLSISSPQLVVERSSDGWRTATLTVPEPAPRPPPRKKRKTNKDLTRSAVSLDDLFDESASPSPNRHRSEICLTTSSSLTHVLEADLPQEQEKEKTHAQEKENESGCDSKENTEVNHLEREMDREVTEVNEQENPLHEITNIDKIPFRFKKNLDELSLISEESTVSLEEKNKANEISETTENGMNLTSAPSEQGIDSPKLTNTNSNETKHTNRTNTAISKREWLQNILNQQSEPNYILDPLRDTSVGLGRDSEDLLKSKESTLCNSSNGGVDSNKGLPSWKTTGLSNSLDHDSPPAHKEESIFLTNTKTNIVYKTLSSDKVSDHYGLTYLGQEEEEAPRNNLESVPKVEKNSADPLKNRENRETGGPCINVWSLQPSDISKSNFGHNPPSPSKASSAPSSIEFVKTTSEVSSVKRISLPDVKLTAKPSIINKCTRSEHSGEDGEPKQLEEQPPSRRSSISDSLHEFEISVYNMLKESTKHRSGSDEE